MENINLDKALEYFKQPGFYRLFEGFRKRYVSLGRVGGTVTLSSLKREEKDVLEGFLQIDCHNRKSLTISVDRMEKALSQTKFSEIPLEELLYGYFPEGMVSKQEREISRKELAYQNFSQMAEGFEATKAGEWFWDMIEKKEGAYLLLRREEEKNQDWALENIPYLLKALNILPVWQKKKQRLPVFASFVAGNPHYFDEGTKMFRFLLYGICGVCCLAYPKKQNAEIKAELLYEAGILKDDISSSVTCIGVTGYLHSGQVHKGMLGFLEQGEMIQLNLQHLGKLKSIEGIGKEVYVVENPSIFQKLAEETGGKASVVCANGQLRLAVLVLLDFLTEAGCIIRYSGDFDPEGLTIAQKLKDRYGEQLYFWHYEREDYMQAKSKEPISEKRLKQLLSLKDTVLQRAGTWIKEEGAAGYQENMLESFRI